MLKISCVATAALLVLGGCMDSPEETMKKLRVSEDAATTEKLRQAVTRNLRDPSSVQFRDERVSKNRALCGELNAKNAFSAYTGFTRFVVEPDGTAHMPTDSGGEFETAWAKHCT